MLTHSVIFCDLDNRIYNYKRVKNTKINSNFLKSNLDKIIPYILYQFSML